MTVKQLLERIKQLMENEVISEETEIVLLEPPEKNSRSRKAIKAECFPGEVVINTQEHWKCKVDLLIS